ncbi:uncharacterized protein METZ01_LOCUS118095 [marine metagenome]|uniref:Uncharacterized protein n=1 Tax=marine metagenome TaxID=408172 RepID=A0A381XLB7_9ZZZZ
MTVYFSVLGRAPSYGALFVFGTVKM